MKFYILSTAIVLLISGCSQQKEVIVPTPPVAEVKKKRVYKPAPKAPKKNIKIKKVEDENFTSDYMYPEAKKSKKSVAKTKEVNSEAKTETETETTVANSDMGAQECIALIGQNKFDKYSQMYGASGALKKCKMLKAI